MGSDFNYLNANTWFKNLDKLIHYTNMDGRIKLVHPEACMATYNPNDHHHPSHFDKHQLHFLAKHSTCLHD